MNRSPHDTPTPGAPQPIHRPAKLERTGAAIAALAILAILLTGCADAPGATPSGPAGVTGSLVPAPPTPTHGEAARRWWRLAQVDEHGRIEAGALRRAWAQRRVNLSRELDEREALLAGAGPARWQSLGPQNVGGRTRSILVDPADPKKILAGSVTGGLWRTSDGGKTWKPVDDFLSTLAIRTLERDPNDANTIYAGTGEAVRGGGIFRSLDRGTSWQLLAGTEDWLEVPRIAVSPADSRRILVATNGGLRLSTDRGRTFRVVQPAYLGRVVAFDPSDPSRAIGAIIDYDFDAENWFWAALFSTDGGNSWKTAQGLDHEFGFFSRIELARAPSQTDIVYAQLSSESTPGEGAIYRSTDGGRSYHLRSRIPDGAVDYMNTIWVSPEDSSFVLAAGNNLFRSTDGGATFDGPINGGSDNTLLNPLGHVDIHTVVPHPGYDGGSNRQIFLGTDGGIFRSHDIRSSTPTAGWSQLNETYQSTQFYAVAATADLVLGGTQDNGTLQLEGADPQASLFFGGDGGYTAIDPRNSDRLYGEYIFLQLARSVDGGENSFFVFENLPDAGDFATANFIAPFALDPGNPHRLLAGGLSLWRTANAWTVAAPTWAEIRPPGSERISDLGISPLSSARVWVAQNDGKIYRSNNATAATPSWTTIDDNAGNDPLPGRFPTRIRPSRHDLATVYAAFGGFEPQNLWRSRDNGNSWQALGFSGPGRLPEAPIRAFAEHPVYSDWLYVGTEVGIFSSVDGGATWSASNQGPANVSVTDLVFAQDTTTLVAATHGRGLWSLDTPSDGCVGSDDALCLASRQFDVRVTWRDQNGKRGGGRAKILTSDTGYFWFFDQSNVEMVIKVLDACSFSGHYWVFAGGLTNVEVEIEVTDTTTGLTRRYVNPLGAVFQPVQDTTAFACGATGRSAAPRLRSHDQGSSRGEAEAAARPTPALQGGELVAPGRGEPLGSEGAGGLSFSCFADDSTLCLADGRYAVRASYRTFDGKSGSGQGVQLTDNTGYFWFFSDNNVEMVLKVLDACSFADHFWVFAGGLTNVEVTTVVTDTRTGLVHIYRNPLGTVFQPIQDTDAFPTCDA